MDQHVLLADGIEAKAEDAPILLLLDHWTTFEGFGLDRPSAPFKSIMEPDRICQDPPDPDHFYDSDEWVVYCRTPVAVAGAEQALQKVKRTCKRVDWRQLMPVRWSRKILCELAKFKERSESDLFQMMSKALAQRWFAEATAQQITRDCLNHLIEVGSIIRREQMVSVNPEMHPNIWDGYVLVRGPKILLENIHAGLPKLKEALDFGSSHWGYEDPIYRFYHQSFKVDSIAESTGVMVNALRQLSDRPFNKWFRQILEDADTSDSRGVVVTASGLEIPGDWLTRTRPKLEAFFHAKFMVEMAVKYGSELKEPPQCLPSGWAALLYLYDLR